MSAAKFTAGQRVRIADRTPPVHHRVPSYAKGRVGVVERVCGVHGMPEHFIRGDGEPRQRIYRVRIPQNDLWPSYDGTDKDVVEIEIFEHWLEPA
ncbi:MAG: nitrile hydratase subunit beta [Woeseiaceae bacterium]|nr:nitrile hydratase subunit beta [Woeseiaceae bacterium]